jgi:hypothetical protein
VVYAYDLVWRAHAIDAAAGPKPLAPVRGLYAASVRHREHAALRAADKVALVGWDDFERVRALGTPAAWCPAGLPQPQISKRPNGQKVRVGFLGNFEHRATLDSALALIRSPVASAVDFEVVLGGWGSNSHPALARSGVTLLGPVSTPGEFWAQIDCAVVPVVSGTGMKVKIAEALLAGRSVITTPLGAAGFPPEIRSAMTVHQDLDHLDGATCRKAIARGNTGADISALEFSAAAQRFSDFVAAPTRSS